MPESVVANVAIIRPITFQPKCGQCGYEVEYAVAVQYTTSIVLYFCEWCLWALLLKLRDVVDKDLREAMEEGDVR